MIHTELIMTTILRDSFHNISEQIKDVNPAQVLQQSKKKPLSKMAYPLAHLKIFQDENSEPSDVKHLLGFSSFGMLVMGIEVDISEITGWSHGLRCLQTPLKKRGTMGLVMYGDAEQWVNAINNAAKGPEPVKDWGVSCYQQFARHNLTDIIGVLTETYGKNKGYFLK